MRNLATNRSGNSSISRSEVPSSTAFFNTTGEMQICTNSNLREKSIVGVVVVIILLEIVLNLLKRMVVSHSDMITKKIMVIELFLPALKIVLRSISRILTTIIF